MMVSYSLPLCQEILLKQLSMERKTLKDLMKEAGYSYRSLAKELDTSHGMLIEYNNGLATPRLDTALAIAAKLRVSLKTLAASMGQDVSDIPDDCGGDISNGYELDRQGEN